MSYLENLKVLLRVFEKLSHRKNLKKTKASNGLEFLPVDLYQVVEWMQTKQEGLR